MKPKMVELRPNQSLLNPNFEGYKLSLATLPLCQSDLPAPIDRATPDTGQYSLLHARLFGLHNHIFAEQIHGMSYVYFIDKEWRVWKLYLEPFAHQFAQPFLVWQIPNHTERLPGQYDVTLSFVTSELVALSDATGVLYLLNSGNRSLDIPWTVAFEGDIFEAKKNFVIQDALCNDKNELHLLLLSIDQDGEHWVNVLNWVVLSRNANTWNVTVVKELRSRGALHYSYIESGCSALLISSENSFKCVTYSVENTEDTVKPEDVQKKFVWSQTIADITIKIQLPANYAKDSLKITTKTAEIVVQYENSVLLSGPLHQNICADLTTWDIKDKVLELLLTKQEEGLMWPELVIGDNSGEFTVDTCIADAAQQKLAHLCSDSELNPTTGTTFNSEQVEECDFIDEKNSYLERILFDTNKVTHRVNLGTSPLVLTVQLHDAMQPALGIRHDVDVCLWQPYKESDDSGWRLEHEGTLHALGYVQASKQQKKFVACTPDLSYSVICESCRHIFVYCQNKPITNGSLRNRNTGERVGTVAEQRVISLDNSDILGLYLTNSELYVLTENKMLCFKL